MGDGERTGDFSGFRQTGLGFIDMRGTEVKNIFLRTKLGKSAVGKEL